MRNIVVTGSHLIPEYGNSIEEIINDGFSVTKKVRMFFRKDKNLQLLNLYFQNYF